MYVAAGKSERDGPDNKLITTAKERYISRINTLAWVTKYAQALAEKERGILYRRMIVHRVLRVRE
jgi:hypothetical protein